MEVGVLAVPVSAAHRGEHHVAARHFALVHLPQVDSLVVHPQSPFVAVQFVADGAQNARAATTTTAPAGGQERGRGGGVAGQGPLHLSPSHASYSSSFFSSSFSSFSSSFSIASFLLCACLALGLGVDGAVLAVAVRLQVVQQDALIAALVGLARGVDAAAGLHAGGGAQVQHHVVVAGVAVVVAAVAVRVLGAGGGVCVVVTAQPARQQAPSGAAQGLQAEVVVVVPGPVDLGQELGAQVSGHRHELGVQNDVVQLFGQQFSVQVDVGAVPA